MKDFEGSFYYIFTMFNKVYVFHWLFKDVYYAGDLLYYLCVFLARLFNV